MLVASAAVGCYQEVIGGIDGRSVPMLGRGGPGAGWSRGWWEVGGLPSPGEVFPPGRVWSERRCRPAGGVGVQPVDHAGGRIGAALLVGPALCCGGDEEPV